MKKFKKILIVLALITFSLAVLACSKKENQESQSASEANWLSDFEAAKVSAAQEGKDLLINITGSDWCPWCTRLKNEVFSTDLFKKEATKNFILVVLDFPRDKSDMSPETIRQNDRLYINYNIAGFPTIVLADDKGKEYARTGYRPGGPKLYLEHLDELIKQKPQ